MSQQGLWWLTNPFITCESSFRGDFWEGKDSVFHDCFWVKRGCVGWRIHSSLVKGVSGATSEWAATQISLIVYESPGAVWADESISHLWKEFRGVFLTMQRVRFPWLFMRQQGPCGMTIPFITCKKSFEGYLWVGSDSVFLDCLWVNRGCLCWRIHSSPMKGVSGAIFDSATSQFSLIVYELTGAVGADESIRHLWKEFRGLLISGQRFHSSPVKGVSGAIFDSATSQFSLIVYELTGAVGADESIRHLWKEFRGLLISGQRFRFAWLFMSQQGLFGLTNPFFICESNFRGDFWEGSDSVFRDSLWVKRGCVGWRIHSSLVKGVSGATSEWAATQFSLIVYESPGAVWADESIGHLWKEFRGVFLTIQRVRFPWLFMRQQGPCGLTNPFITCKKSFEGYLWVGSDSVFLDCLWVNRGCLCWRIHSSPVKGVSGAIFDSATSQFSLIVYELTGAVGADESIRHLWKEFRGLLISGQRFHSSPVKGVSGAIFDSATSQFSLIVYELTGAVGADESIRHLW